MRVAAAELIERGKADEARRTVEAFHAGLAQTRVLDPACGTGNFLYVAMARMKELEGEVLDLLADLRPEGEEYQYLAVLTGHTITPENFWASRSTRAPPPSPNWCCGSAISSGTSG